MKVCPRARLLAAARAHFDPINAPFAHRFKSIRRCGRKKVARREMEPSPRRGPIRPWSPNRSRGWALLGGRTRARCATRSLDASSRTSSRASLSSRLLQATRDHYGFWAVEGSRSISTVAESSRPRRERCLFGRSFGTARPVERRRVPARSARSSSGELSRVLAPLLVPRPSWRVLLARVSVRRSQQWRPSTRTGYV